MRRVIYSMGMSLDGYVADREGEISLPGIDEELHRFYNRQTEEQAVQVCGRRLYEVMLYWETVEETNPSAADVEVEFARIWKAMPKVVVSRTLDEVVGNYRLVRDGLEDEIRRLKAEPGEGEIGVGGAELAAALVRADLIDEYRPVVHPVVFGGGTPFLPPLERRLDLRLVETRRFASGNVYLRYQRG